MMYSGISHERTILDRWFCPLQRGFPLIEVDFFVPGNNDDNDYIIETRV